MKSPHPTSPRSSSDSSAREWPTSSPAAEELSGVRLGRYELLFPLASGGMGAVYVGRVVGREGIGRLVAVKVMLNRNPGDADVQAFLSEARVTARLDHPNVVRTIELGEEQGSLFIAMDLIRGQSLRKVLATLGKQRQHLPVAEVARIMIQAANGLHAAHELRDSEGQPLDLIHRDLSPDNILLSYTGQIFVSDFGVAKLSNTASTHTGVVKGKFAYMSPEQVSAEPLDRRSDIFALGILLWEALTGRRLFKGGTPRETVAAILRCAVKDPQTVRPDLPERLAQISMRCLEHSADRRYATAEQVADELRDCVKSLGLSSDERDLVDLLEQLFGNERRELNAKLDEAERASKTRTSAAQLGTNAHDAQAAAPSMDQSEPTGGTLASAVSDTGARPKMRRLALGVALVLASGVGSAFFLMQRSGDSDPLSTDTSPTVGAERPVAADEILPPVVYVPTPAVSSTPPAVSSAPLAASASAVPPSTKPPRNNRPSVTPKPPPTKRKDDLFENL